MAFHMRTFKQVSGGPVFTRHTSPSPHAGLMSLTGTQVPHHHQDEHIPIAQEGVCAVPVPLAPATMRILCCLCPHTMPYQQDHAERSPLARPLPLAGC